MKKYMRLIAENPVFMIFVRALYQSQSRIVQTLIITHLVFIILDSFSSKLLRDEYLLQRKESTRDKPRTSLNFMLITMTNSVQVA